MKKLCIYDEGFYTVSFIPSSQNKGFNIELTTYLATNLKINGTNFTGLRIGTAISIKDDMYSKDAMLVDTFLYDEFTTFKYQLSLDKIQKFQATFVKRELNVLHDNLIDNYIEAKDNFFDFLNLHDGKIDNKSYFIHKIDGKKYQFVLEYPKVAAFLNMDINSLINHIDRQKKFLPDNETLLIAKRKLVMEQDLPLKDSNKKLMKI